jgi:iron only hydrogenase large subunit-like protein
MEAAVRTAYKLAAGKELEGGPKVAEARGDEGVRRFTVTAGDAQLNLAVVNGLGRVKDAMPGLLDPEAGLHFVEVMSCPGGCIGGGGQPYDTDAHVIKERLERLYDVDRRSRTRRAHENADVQALYEELLGRPLGEVSHRLLHRAYTDRSPDPVTT